jgi:hypothetical protein
MLYIYILPRCISRSLSSDQQYEPHCEKEDPTPSDDERRGRDDGGGGVG